LLEDRTEKPRPIPREIISPDPLINSSDLFALPSKDGDAHHFKITCTESMTVVRETVMCQVAHILVGRRTYTLAGSVTLMRDPGEPVAEARHLARLGYAIALGMKSASVQARPPVQPGVPGRPILPRAGFLCLQTRAVGRLASLRG
jgi:hypothetical protein